MVAIVKLHRDVRGPGTFSLPFVNQVGKCLASKLPRAQFAKGKLQRVENVGLSRAVGSSNNGEAPVETNGDLLAKGLESSNIDSLDEHQGGWLWNRVVYCTVLGSGIKARFGRNQTQRPNRRLRLW